MYKTIYKLSFPIDLGVDRHTFRMPRGSVLRHCGQQVGVPTLWFECDLDVEEEERTFCIVGTGRKVPDGPWSYVGTSQCSTEQFVWHWYEKVR